MLVYIYNLRISILLKIIRSFIVIFLRLIFIGTSGYHFEIQNSGVTFKWRKEKDGAHEMSMRSESDGYFTYNLKKKLKYSNS